jgi:adenylylsulfate kinase
VAQLLARNGVAVICSFVSPYVSTREYARRVVKNFVEVYVKASIDTCRKRDPKGLYRRATEGQIVDMTGVQDVYEPPPSPDLTVDTENSTIEESAKELFEGLHMLGWL